MRGVWVDELAVDVGGFLWMRGMWMGEKVVDVGMRR